MEVQLVPFVTSHERMRTYKNMRYSKIIFSTTIQIMLMLLAATFLTEVSLAHDTPEPNFWTNPNGGFWSNPNNWSFRSVPDDGESAFIRLDGTYTITLDVDNSPKDIDLGGSSGTQTLLISGRTFSFRGKDLGTIPAVRANGVLRLTNGATLVSGPSTEISLINHGTVQMDGSTISANVINQDPERGALLEVQGGTCTINGYVNNQGGTLHVQRTGQFGDVILAITQPKRDTNDGLFNHRTIIIDQGRIDVTGDYNQDDKGRLNLEIGGATAGRDFGQLKISRTAELDGRLNVSLVNGYVPRAGDSFEIITYNSRNGEFATINGLDIGAGLSFEANYGPKSLALVVVGDSSVSIPPPAPTNLTTTVISSTQIDLAWQDRAGDETGFQIERLTGGEFTGSGGFTQIATVGANVTQHSDTGLQPDTGYTYRVRAINTGGNSDWSQVSAGTTLSGGQGDDFLVNIAPSAPTNLAVAAVSSTQIDLSWRTGDRGISNIIELMTSKGKVVLQLFPETAPVTVNNFKELTRKQFYDRLTFHRRVDDATLNIIQGGDPNGDGTGGPGYTIVDEYRLPNQRPHLRGTVAMARTNAPNSAGSQFYIVLKPQPHLDGQYTTFGQVIEGMDVVDQLRIGDIMETVRFTAETQIERRIGTGRFTRVATVSPDLSRHSDTDLQPNIAYTYRVRTINAVGNSQWSNQVSQTTVADPVVTTPPLAPGGLTATAISSTQIDLLWRDAANNETGFQIERRIGTGGFTRISTVGADVTRHSDTDLQPNTAYTYRVRAINAIGNSSWSNQVSQTTLPAPVVTTVPLAPANLTATAISSTQIDLAWQDRASNETDFQIERRIGNGGFTQIAIVSANATNHRDTGLQPETAYTYRVRAINALGNSGWSNQVTRTISETRPVVQIDLTAMVISSSRIDLSWNTDSSNANAFELERKTENGVFALIATRNVDERRYSDTGLPPGTSYTYRVRATNAVGGSDWSNQAIVTTSSTNPIVEILLAPIVVSDTQIDLNWEASPGAGITFGIDRKTENRGFAQIATVDADVTRYSDVGLTPGVRYTYRIRAISAVGDAGISNQVTLTPVITSPPSPSNLMLTVVSKNQINLTWQDNSENESGFEIDRKTEADLFFRAMVTVGAAATAYSDTNLQPNTVYTYRICAFNGAGNSEPSNAVVFDPSLIGKPEFELIVPEGVGFIHLPLAVVAVNGQPAQMQTVGDFYDALGPNNVHYILTYDSQAAKWRSFFGDASRGTPADAPITDEMGVITMMRRSVTLRLQGEALGRNGVSELSLNPGMNLVGVPLRDNRLQRISDLLSLEDIRGNAREIIVADNGTFKVVAQPGDAGDIPITGGQAFIITANEIGVSAIIGRVW